MLAPPAKRRADRTRKRRQLRREKLGLHRCQLWLTDRALEGLITQLVATGKLTDKAANDHRNIETAIAALLEAQGRRWTP
jgi:hypothetical protein